MRADDLAVSVGLEPVLFSDPVVDLVVETLSKISRKRHGDLAVIRSLSRPARASSRDLSILKASATGSADAVNPLSNGRRVVKSLTDTQVPDSLLAAPVDGYRVWRTHPGQV